MRKWLAIVTTGVLSAGTLVAGGTTAAHAADPALLQVTKNVVVDGVVYEAPEVPVVEVGQEFQWTIDLVCQQTTDQCVNATLTDVVPAEFEIIAGSINTGAIPSNITVTGQTVSVVFEEQLDIPAGEVGLSAGATVTIPVRLRPIPVERDGEIFINSATSTADNSPEGSDTASVEAEVQFTLVAEASKEFDPAASLADPGAPVSLTFGGANLSNGAVDTLIVQDPVDPTASPNIFQQYLQVESLTSAS